MGSGRNRRTHGRGAPIDRYQEGLTEGIRRAMALRDVAEGALQCLVSRAGWPADAKALLIKDLRAALAALELVEEPTS